MLGDRNTFKPARVQVEGLALDAGDPNDRAQEHFGNLVDEPTLVRSFPVAKLPVFPIAVEIHSAGGVRLDALHGVRVALGWDGAQTFEAAPVKMGAGTVVTLEVDRPKGSTLEVWADASSPLETDAGEIDDVLVVSLAEGRARARENADRPTLPADDPFGLKGLGLGLALVAILGLAVWFGVRPRGGGA